MDFKYLGKVNTPDQLKKLNNEELPLLCKEIREHIITTVSENGGHLASNLGVVELTVALHRVFNSPDDSIIFDVGHQSYTHKLLTGRFENFSSLRKKDGVSGFMRPNESEHDPVVTGHSSSSISAAMGIAKTNTLANNGNYSIAVVGDGAFSGGMVFEALNNAIINNDRLIVVYNDNKMSISKNVGAIARSLSTVRINPTYYRFKRLVDRLIKNIPIIGMPIRNKLNRSKNMLKNVIYHSNYFENLGFKYLGPIDGHDIHKLTQTLKIAKGLTRPVIIHALTIKGKGYKYSEARPNNYHGVSAFNTSEGINDSESLNFSNIMGNFLCDMAEKDDKICAITAAMTDGTGLQKFAEKFPDRFFDVAIAEQHAVTFAAGLAKGGYKPFFAVYSTFLQRGFDQIIHDAAIANLPITLCVDRAGLVGNDGETHQGIFDISYLSLIPNVTILAPSNYIELCHCLELSAKHKSGVYVIRYPRGKEILKDYLFNGSYASVNNGKNTVVVSYGINFSICKKALQNNVDYIKLNVLTDITDELISILNNYKNIFVFEETVLNGSIGQKLANLLLLNGYKGNFKNIAVKNEFVLQATQDEQRALYNLDEQSIKNIVLGDISGK